eukprot:NODE_39338_length_170_cov_1.669421_g38168_i0.p2 GENE.NODE_39338_length_170_cov_1.669421_g38168_i0~~NODE_39338_length_170_cov_1.669421_g38168_i0.p2  ORF type:complete len:51 (+),score=12.86 NODE_39338_length_170_cov_1.669421_g38168_i0:13-165(+)
MPATPDFDLDDHNAPPSAVAGMSQQDLTILQNLKSAVVCQDFELDDFDDL